MKKTAYFLILSVVLLLSSCMTNKNIPEDLSPAQIIQLGQNAIDSTDYKHAEKCFNTVISRYGTNIATYIEARYELGHLYIKVQDYSKAYSIFSEILDAYSTAAISELPPEFKKLSQIGLSQIPEKKLASLQKASLAEEE